MKIDINRERTTNITLNQLKVGQIGRVVPSEGDYLFVMRCADNTVLRIWPLSNEICPLINEGNAGKDWLVELMPVGSSLTFTVE